MSHRLSREELYDLVWSEPRSKLSTKFGISDVAISKACRRADIPVPEPGYWARLQAGKSADKRSLPPRGLGMSDWVTIGEDRSWWYREDPAEKVLTEPIPPPPNFPEEISAVTERVRKMVGKVTVPVTLTRTHPVIARVLEEDNRRREKQLNASYQVSW